MPLTGFYSIETAPVAYWYCSICSTNVFLFFVFHFLKKTETIKTGSDKKSVSSGRESSVSVLNNTDDIIYLQF